MNSGKPPQLPIRSRPGARTYTVALCFLLLFAVPGVMILVKSGDPAALLIMAGVMAFVFVNIAMIRFECTETSMTYQSMFKQLYVPLDDITGVRIGPVDLKKRAPMFVLETGRHGRVVLLVRALPVADVQQFAALLAGRNIPFSVDRDFMSRRMAAQIFPESV